MRLQKKCECPICGGEMTYKTNISRTFHYKGKEVELKNLTGYECEECKEVIYSGEEAQIIESLMHALEGSVENANVDVLNLEETADFLRVRNETVYYMIRGGRIKAHKVGREWRFFRSDIAAYVNQTSNLAMAAKGGSMDKSDLCTIQAEIDKRKEHHD